jgi:hypothetical protein
MAGGEFSVCQFFPDGTYEYTRRYVPAQEAVTAFVHYCTSVGAKMGTTARVILTDGGDEINMEWKYEDGIVFPEDQRGHYKHGELV